MPCGARGQWDAAVIQYKEALRLRPDHAGTYNTLGVTLANRGQLPAAIHAYQEAIRLDPNEIWARNNLGLALRAQGNLDSAIAAVAGGAAH